MRIQTKRTLQVALLSGGLLTVGTGVASAAEVVDPGVPASPVDQLVPNSGLPGVADTVNGATDELQAASTGVDLQHPAQALGTVLPLGAQQQRPAPVLHTVPLHLLQYLPAPSAAVDGELPEPDLNAPLGSELAATEMPVLPATVPLTAAADAEPARATVDRELPTLPLHGTVSTRPLDFKEGTRVTGLNTAAAQPGAPANDRRADAPAAGLPLLGGLLPSTGGVLPALNGVADVTQLASLAGLTQLTGSTPLTQAGRYNTGAVTAPPTQHAPATLGSPTALLGK
ncbi:hypothetical protein Q5425_19130 [Amycolatopsis sp. A133]|uniref:hypothetical protein n=1 Tax=Amycolatopsis sp. A133 TaxID=3064472 RepID=UPI0027E88616|nr:hypothetical protein [Amycolatopsis sp. A133]MDQ7805862.1 hypothetical protein [Amycolatopsis sp. A133]